MFCFVILCNVCNKVLKKKKKVNGREKYFQIIKVVCCLTFCAGRSWGAGSNPGEATCSFFSFFFFFQTEYYLY